ncbi:MAG: DUF2278 family protein [Terrimicrobiaceae bacterium]
MPVAHYGLLAGSVIGKLDSAEAKQKNPAGTPHYQILVEAAGLKYRIAINVKSDQQPPDLQFYLDENYKHPILEEVARRPVGFSTLMSKPNTAALDFIRGDLFKMGEMRIVPDLKSGSNNDLNDIVNLYVEQAMKTHGALIYAFGSKWGPEPKKRDDYFGFLPGNGIHDIHMNQGNRGSHADDNGVYQDGGLLIFYPDEPRWVAMFLKFQSQAEHTDDVHGDPIDGPAPQVSGSIKVFAALVNPKADDAGKECVYLLNITDEDIDLNGWMIADKLKKKDTIRGKVLKAGDVARIFLSGQNAQLSNDGGIITLLNKDGLKIDGVSYTKRDATKQGFVIAF